MTDTPLVSNVLSVYNNASADNIREGLSWYLDANNFARTLGEIHDVRISTAAGVLAALSPRLEWGTNKRQAAKVFATGTADGCGLKGNCRKADRILAGEDPLDVLGGNKVRAFYSTILDPHGYSWPVIDRHAFDIAVGEITDDKRRGALGRKGVYAEFADIYIDAAKVAGVSSSQMQAITWVAWREMKGGN